MKKSVYWTKAKTELLQEVFKKAEQGTKVVYILGNHDNTFREFAGTTLRNIDIKLNDVHVSKQGDRLFVSHGDEFDVLIKRTMQSLSTWVIRYMSYY